MWQSVGTVLLSGIGAFLAGFAAKWLESWSRGSQIVEAQRDADLADILASAKDLTDIAEKFWTKSATVLGEEDAILKAHMVAAQHHIAEVIAILFKGPAKWNCDVCFHRLALAATGGDCGEPDRDAEPQRLAEILIAFYAIQREVKMARRSLRRSFMA